MEAAALFTMVFMVGIAGGVLVVYLGLRQRTEQLQMQHRERLAMIERGQIPLNDPGTGSHRAGPGQASNNRSLSIGIIVVGFGLALALVIAMAAGNPEVGIGVGGAIAILGSAFIVKSLVVRPLSGSQLPIVANPPSDDARRSE